MERMVLYSSFSAVTNFGSHTALGLMFLLAGVKEMALFNFFISLPMILVAFVLSRKERYTIFWTIMFI